MSSADITARLAMTEGPMYDGSVIEVNGVNISTVVSRVVVDCTVGEPTRATITIPVALLQQATAHPEVCPTTRSALLALGWTQPPQQDTEALASRAHA